MTGVISRMREEHGVVAANLAITLGFALFAVIELTRTLVAANSIDDRVKVIVGEVVPINQDLDQVAKLDETARMAGEILTAAKPLTGQAGQIVDATASIDASGSNILSNATSINGIVKGINGNASGILGSVGPINTNARGINGNLSALQPVVRSIDQGVADINGRAAAVINQTIPIEQDLSTVVRQVDSINANANGICEAPVVNLVAGGGNCN